MRGWINNTRSYIPPVELNSVMRSGSVGKVIQVNGTTTVSYTHLRAHETVLEHV